MQRGTKRKGLAMLLSLTFLAGGYVLALEKQLHWRTPPDHRRENSNRTRRHRLATVEPRRRRQSPRRTPAGLRRFHRGLVRDVPGEQEDQHRDRRSVRKKLEEIGAVTLLGDYTLVPDDTSRKSSSASAVPPCRWFSSYPKDPAKPPVELPAILTPGIVLDEVLN